NGGTHCDRISFRISRSNRYVSRIDLGSLANIAYFLSYRYYHRCSLRVGVDKTQTDCRADYRSLSGYADNSESSLISFFDSYFWNWVGSCYCLSVFLLDVVEFSYFYLSYNDINYCIIYDINR